MTLPRDLKSEWIEVNGLGGFASGTVGGPRTRRYHALLLTANASGRFVLVSGFDAWVEAGGEVYPLSSQYYAGDVVHPSGQQYLANFTLDPWPRWTYQMPGAIEIEHELWIPHESDSVVLRWRMNQGPQDAVLVMRPFLAVRDYHTLIREDSSFCFDVHCDGERVRWKPRDGLPSVQAHSNGAYRHDPVWYYDFLYRIERQRGLDDTEDLASPGEFRWTLQQEEAVWIATTESDEGSARDRSVRLEEKERARRSAFSAPLDRAADVYLIRSGDRRTVIAGYPWFTDWGRDTFIAVRGLCLATGRLRDCEEILLAWSECVDDGMLPNRFPDRGAAPEFNSVDASLWYVIAVDDFLQTARDDGHDVTAKVAGQLQQAVDAILEGYRGGTRYNIHAAEDGLIAAGESGVQLTWMDAKVDDWVVTPRIGKPVEIQALWINALAIASRRSENWRGLYQKALESFQRRFWNPHRQCLYDVIDVDHRSGTVDESIRPNQIFALGGLPLTLLSDQRARSVLETVERHLATPLGLRTLAPDDSRYRPVYRGDIWQRDGAYHQGTAWLWLAGPWIESWVRLHGRSPATLNEVHRRWIQPLLEHLDQAGLGHLSEIADGDAPHPPRGCPFQAWSISELLRVQRRVLKSAR